MQREIRQTADGSPTLFVPALNEHYHSVHGAMQESRHVFIKHGLQARPEPSLAILEMGFGTGLNAWLTALEAEKTGRHISYVSIEKYPLTPAEISSLHFQSTEIKEDDPLFYALHAAPWAQVVPISPNFSLTKWQRDFRETHFLPQFHLIYFDAFAPEVQPDLWTVAIFKAMHHALLPGGTLLTYCAKGQVKRNMKEAGFGIEPLPGPPGKREITRALKV